MCCQILLKGVSEFLQRRIQEMEGIIVSLALGEVSI